MSSSTKVSTLCYPDSAKSPTQNSFPQRFDPKVRHQANLPDMVTVAASTQTFINSQCMLVQLHKRHEWYVRVKNRLMDLPDCHWPALVLFVGSHKRHKRLDSLFHDVPVLFWQPSEGGLDFLMGNAQRLFFHGHLQSNMLVWWHDHKHMLQIPAQMLYKCCKCQPSLCLAWDFWRVSL